LCWEASLRSPNQNGGDLAQRGDGRIHLASCARKAVSFLSSCFPHFYFSHSFPFSFLISYDFPHEMFFLTLFHEPIRRSVWKGWEAANQTCAIARLRKWRQRHLGVLPRAALGGSATCQNSLALGYYRPPFQGFQFAASQAFGDHRTHGIYLHRLQF
jgi:hypothetical protein